MSAQNSAPATRRGPGTPLVQLQHRHVEALRRAGAAGCATCHPKPHPPAPRMRPGTYTLRFHEFRDAIAALDVADSKAKLGPDRWRNVASTNTVYLFRRFQGKTTLVTALHGGGTYTLVVRPAEAEARFYACVSQFGLPYERVAQYLAPNGIELVRARCAPLDLDDRRTMVHAGGSTYDVVLCDYRRGATELWAYAALPLGLLEKWSTDVERATTRVLAMVTLAVIRDRAKKDADVWTWIRPPQYTGTRRLPGNEGMRFTSVEQTLIDYQVKEESQQGFAEAHATRLYGWMRLPPYREMLYDGVYEPAAARNAIIAEGTLIGAAPRTASGRKFLRQEAMRVGTWWARCVSQLTAPEKAAVRAGGEATAAFATIVTTIGSARLGALQRHFAGRKEGFRVDDGVKFTKELFDIFKNVFGFVDAIARQPWSAGVTELEEALKKQAKTAVAGEKAAAAAAERAATATKRVIDLETALRGMRALVVEETWVRATVMVWGKRPPLLAYTIRDQNFRVVHVHDAGPALFQPEVQAWLAPIRSDAAAAERGATAAAETAARQGRAAEHTVLEFRTEALGRAGFPGASAAFGSAFAIANAILVWQAFETEHRLRSTVESIGATGDLLFSAEFFVDMTAVAAHGSGGVLGALGPAAERTLGAVRGAGFVGAVISVALGMVDTGNAVADREYGLASGYAIGVVGNIGVATIIGSSAYASIFAETEFTTAVAGSRVLGPAAVLLVVIGAAVVWYYKSHELQRFLERSAWGIHPSHDSVPTQLDNLLHILSGPEVTVEEFMNLPTPPGGSARGRYGLCFTIKPGLFLADQSALSVSLQVRATSRSIPIAVGSMGTAPPSSVTVDDPDVGTLHFSVGPLSAADLIRSRKQELLLGGAPVRGVTGTAIPSVTVDFRGGVLPTFRFYVPLRRHLTDVGPPAHESRIEAFLGSLGKAITGGEPLITYGARGKATLKLWAPDRNGATAAHPREGTRTAQLLSDVEFKPFDLEEVPLKPLHR